MRFDHIYESWYEALSLSVEIANWIYLLTGESIRPISVLNISIFPIRYIFVQFLFFFFNFIIFRYDNDDSTTFTHGAMQFTR